MKHYKPDEIETAKRKLFEICPSGSRVLASKGQKKHVQNLEDIVKRMNELDSAVDVIPGFVARDLGNLPPITFDSLDVSVLLTKIESLNDEVLLMRGAMKCQQTTSEALTNVCSETISRVHKLEGEMLGVRSPGCPDVSMKVTPSCQLLRRSLWCALLR